MSVRDEKAPNFAPSVRGYQRQEVDEYVAWLREYAIEVEDRAAAAESALLQCRRELATPGGEGVPQRLAAILDLAKEEADEIRARAEADAEAMRHRATNDAERTVSEANEQRDAIQQETDDLFAIRRELLDQLVELGDRIQDATQRYLAGPVPKQQHGAVELFDAEAVDDATTGEESASASGANNPVTAVDPDAETQQLTSTGQTPEP